MWTVNQRSHSSTLQVFTRTGRRAERLAGTARAVLQPAVITNELNWWPQLPPSICITTITTSILWLPSLALHTSLPFASSLTHYILHNSQNTLLPASPSAASMTPVSEHQQPKEPGTQAATSHHAPAVPSKSMLFLHMYRTVDHESCIVSSLILTLSILENMMLGQDE